MVKKPVFKLVYKGEDITESIRPNLLSLTYRDESGDDADEVVIELSGQRKHWDFGDEVAVYLGYEKEPLFPCGTFKVLTSERSDRGLTVSCTGVDFASDFKVQRSTSYEGVSLAQIVRIIADRHGLKWFSDFDDVSFPHLSQADESDMHFLRRLADDYNALHNVKNGTIIFRKRIVGGQRSPKLSKIAINAADVWGLKIKRHARNFYNSVVAIWMDLDTNKTEEIKVGSGGPVFNLDKPFQNAAQAKLRAEAKLQRLKRGTRSGRFTAPGRFVEAGGTLVLSGSYLGEDDESYTVKQVEHRFDLEGGWTMRVELEF